MNQYIQSHQSEIEKAMEFFKKEISSLNIGRAKPGLLENVIVDAYGVKSALNTLAGISVIDSKTLTVAPWDASIIKTVEKAIVDSNLGVGVKNEGDKIIITIPQMTEEKRKDIVKILNEKHEKARISVRQIRDQIKEGIENAYENKDIGEDEKFRYLKDLDEKINEVNNNLKTIRDNKEEELMTV